MGKSTPVLVITCAAIAREVNEIKKLGQWSQMDLQAITADLHARPEKIPAAVADKIDAARGQYQHIFVAYGDCGTSGELDRVLEERGVKRLPGAHRTATIFSPVATGTSNYRSRSLAAFT
jgi:hypothetical protein